MRGKIIKFSSYLSLGFIVIIAGGAYMAHNPNRLWDIVHGQCAINAHHKPCVIYDDAQAYSLLKDKKGKGQYLLIPTTKITGVEDPALIDPKTPNYLQIAWDLRDYVKHAYQKPLSDEMLSLAVNSVKARSQNQLHIHIDCVRQEVLDDLDKLPFPTEEMRMKLGRGYYNVFPLKSLDPSPFLRFASLTQAERGRHGLAILYRGAGKFLLLEEVVEGLDFGEVEYVQDHECRKSMMLGAR